MNNESPCDQLESCIMEYVGDELAPQEKRAMDDHVRTCDRCRKLVEDVRAGYRALSTLPRVPAPQAATDRLIWEAVAKHLSKRVGAAKPPTSIELRLTPIGGGQWEVEDIDTKIRLADYLIELQLRNIAGHQMRAAVVSISDPYFELQPVGYAMAAGDAEPLQEAQVRFVLPDGSSGCLDLVQDESGSITARSNTLEPACSIRMILNRKEKAS